MSPGLEECFSERVRDASDKKATLQELTRPQVVSAPTSKRDAAQESTTDSKTVVYPRPDTNQMIPFKPKQIVRESQHCFFMVLLAGKKRCGVVVVQIIVGLGGSIY